MRGMRSPLSSPCRYPNRPREARATQVHRGVSAQTQPVIAALPEAHRSLWKVTNAVCNYQDAGQSAIWNSISSSYEHRFRSMYCGEGTRVTRHPRHLEDPVALFHPLAVNGHDFLTVREEHEIKGGKVAWGLQRPRIKQRRRGTAD